MPPSCPPASLSPHFSTTPPKSCLHLLTPFSHPTPSLIRGLLASVPVTLLKLHQLRSSGISPPYISPLTCHLDSICHSWPFPPPLLPMPASLGICATHPWDPYLPWQSLTGFFFFRIFKMCTILKVFIEFVAILLLFFYVLGFWSQDMWDLSSSNRDQTCSPRKGR